MRIESLHQLPRFQDRIGYLYLEKGHIVQESKSVAYVTEQGKIPIPVADLTLLMLGPGTTITHQAVCNLADCNCTVVWCGEEGIRFYAHGRGGTHFSANLLHQVRLACNPRTQARVVRRMYEKRFGETVPGTMSIQSIRGKEGHRVRTAYQSAAQATGVQWSGRRYDPHNWEQGDPLNRALSAASACLNGLVHAGIVSSGYSPAVGFIHTGKMLSFVYDIADLYKVDLLVPLAFRLVAEGEAHIERRVRLACRDLFREQKLVQRILPDIREVLDGRDDSGECAAQPEGRSESLDDRTQGRDLPRPHDRPSP